MTRLADVRPRAAASPDMLVFPGDPGWGTARSHLGVGDRTPAAVALPRTAADAVALVEHAAVVGLEIAVRGVDELGAHLDGVVVVGLDLVAARERETVVAALAATPRCLR